MELIAVTAAIRVGAVALKTALNATPTAVATGGQLDNAALNSTTNLVRQQSRLRTCAHGDSVLGGTGADLVDFLVPNFGGQFSDVRGYGARKRPSVVLFLITPRG